MYPFFLWSLFSCSSDKGNCPGDVLVQLQETCLSYDGSFSAYSSLSDLTDCEAAAEGGFASSGASADCKLEGEGDCAITCSIPVTDDDDDDDDGENTETTVGDSTDNTGTESSTESDESTATESNTETNESTATESSTETNESTATESSTDSNDSTSTESSTESNGETSTESSTESNSETNTETNPAEMTGPHGGKMILIPAQTFTMGCTAGQQDECWDDEYPAHEVTLSGSFYMGETEVTQAQYESVMGENPSHFSNCGSDCPVEQVSWHDAAAYANALSLSEGLTECYSCTGVSFEGLNSGGIDGECEPHESL